MAVGILRQRDASPRVAITLQAHRIGQPKDVIQLIDELAMKCVSQKQLADIQRKLDVVEKVASPTKIFGAAAGMLGGMVEGRIPLRVTDTFSRDNLAVIMDWRSSAVELKCSHPHQDILWELEASVDIFEMLHDQVHFGNDEEFFKELAKPGLWRLSRVFLA